MDLQTDLVSLFFVLVVAALAPILVGWFRLPVPEVVLLLVGGMIVGPSLLHLVQLNEGTLLLKQVGLGFLFFVAGFELDPAAVRGATGRRAVVGWFVSLTLAVVAVIILGSLGVVRAETAVAIALTSTALGTLLPVVRDRGWLPTPFGRNFMAAGAIGEFGPILAMSLLLGSHRPSVEILILLVFGLAVLVVVWLPPRLNNPRLQRILERGYETSSQTTVRLTVTMVIGLLALAGIFGLDVVLGAFAAGIALRMWAAARGGEPQLERKVEGLAFGFFVPVFFVLSGAGLDLASIRDNPLRLLLFFVLLLVVRGLPTLAVYLRAVPDLAERTHLMLYVATGLPIIVAVTDVATASGDLLPANGAALVGAGALSVLVFPLSGDLIARRTRTPQPRAAATA